MPSTRPVWTPTVDPEDLDHILSHTSSLWEEVRSQRLFITGGTGFFGHWMLESLLWANDALDLDVKLVLLSRHPDAFSKKYPQLSNHPAVSWIQGDVKTFDFPEGDFSFVIHAASEGDVNLVEENPLLLFDTIVEGTHRVLEFARTHNTRKLLFTSSGAVYGRQPPEITHIPEDYIGAPDVMDPRSAYGEGKRAAELLCNIYARQYGFEAKIARCFAFVGPYLPLNANFAIGNFIRDAIKGGPIVIKGDGTPYRSYLYAADLAIWLCTILINGRACRPYNVGSGEALTIWELAHTIAQSSATTLTVQITKSPVLGQPIERYVPATQRAYAELHLQPWITLPEAIQRTTHWHFTRGS
jgi:nucleoside-diphosphate-sugar epimerase